MSEAAKRYIGYSVFSWLIFALIAVSYNHFILPKQLKQQVEARGEAFLGVPLKIESAKFIFFPIPRLQVSRINFEHPKLGIAVRVDTFTVGVEILKLLREKALAINLEMNRPEVKLLAKLPEAQVVGSSAMDPAPLLPPLPGIQVQMKNPVSLDLRIVEGSFALNKDLKLDKTNLNFFLPAINEAAQIDFKANVNFTGGSFLVTTPVTAVGDLKYHLESTVLSSSGLTIGVWGISTLLKGESQLQEMTNKWKVLSKIPNLAEIKIPQDILVNQNLKGVLTLDAEFNQKLFEKSQFAGSLVLADGSGEIELKGSTFEAKGLFGAAGKLSFQLGETRSARFDVTADLSAMKISGGPGFEKPIGLRCSAKLIGGWSGDFFELETSLLKLAQLELMSSGKIATRLNSFSNFRFKIPKSKLEGIEQLSPWISKVQMIGAIELNGELSGGFDNPSLMDIKLKTLRLEGVKAVVAYDKNELKVVGPATVSLDATIAASGAELTDGNVDGSADFSGLDITKVGRIFKPALSPLAMRLIGKKKGSALDFSSSNLRTAAGTVKIEGLVQEVFQPRINLRLLSDDMDMGQLAKIFPVLVPWNIVGRLKSDLALGGTVKFAGAESSTLLLTGGFLGRFSNVSFQPTALAVTTSAPEPDVKKENPAVFANSNFLGATGVDIKMDLQIEKLKYNKLSAKKFRLLGKVSGKDLSGEVTLSPLVGTVQRAPGVNVLNNEIFGMKNNLIEATIERLPANSSRQLFGN